MPPKKKPKFSYTHEDLLRALDTVKQGEKVNSASKRFGIPTLDAMVNIQSLGKWHLSLF